jgi:anti-sigma B factor antagonist
MKTMVNPISCGAQVSHGTCGEIAIQGELDLAGVSVLEDAAESLELPGLRDLVLNLRELDFIDAAGLRAVLDLYAECQSVGTTLTIIPGPRRVHRVFQLTRLDRLLPFSPT